MDHLFNTIQTISWAVIVNIVMEAYQQRRATEQVGDYDKGME